MGGGGDGTHKERLKLMGCESDNQGKQKKSLEVFFSIELATFHYFLIP